jgi:hypothetical protein
MSNAKQSWKVERWGKSWMVMRPGPVGLVHYVRSPCGCVKFFRSHQAAQAAADQKNAMQEPKQ